MHSFVPAVRHIITLNFPSAQGVSNPDHIVKYMSYERTLCVPYCVVNLLVLAEHFHYTIRYVVSIIIASITYGACSFLCGNAC